MLSALANATGARPLAPMLELYRIRWDLADIAEFVSRFRKLHPGQPRRRRVLETSCVTLFCASAAQRRNLGLDLWLLVTG